MKTGATATLRVRRKDGTLTEGRKVKNYAAMGYISTSPVLFMHGGPIGASGTYSTTPIAYTYEDVSEHMRPARAGETVNIEEFAENASMQNKMVVQSGSNYTLNDHASRFTVYAMENGDRFFGISSHQASTQPVVFHEDYLGTLKDAKPPFPTDQQVCQYSHSLYSYVVRNSNTLVQEVTSPVPGDFGTRGDNIIGFPAGSGEGFSMTFEPAASAYKCHLLIVKCYYYACYFWLIGDPIEVGVGDSIVIDDFSVEFHRMPVTEFASNHIAGLATSGRYFYCDQQYLFNRDSLRYKDLVGVIKTANALSFPPLDSIDDRFSITDLGGDVSTVDQWLDAATVEPANAVTHHDDHFDRFSKGLIFLVVPEGGLTDVKQLVVHNSTSATTELFFLIEFDTPQTLEAGKVITFNFEAYSDAFDTSDPSSFQFPFIRDTDFPSDYPVDWSTKW